MIATDKKGCDRLSKHRTYSGVIDIAYYERRLRKLRTRWMRLCLRRFVAGVVAAWRRQREVMELHALDERSLRDIGITRADIPAIANGVYFRDESRKQRDSRVGEEGVRALGVIGDPLTVATRGE